MPLLFTIKTITKTADYITVITNKTNHIINRQKFEKWVDDDKKRVHLTWDQYYGTLFAYEDLYDYLVIRQGSQNFDIQPALDKIL